MYQNLWIYSNINCVLFCADYPDQDKPSVFEEVLRPRFNYKKSDKKILQVELHFFISPTDIKASILLNKLRLVGIFDLILELKSFVFDKIEEEIEEGEGGRGKGEGGMGGREGKGEGGRERGREGKGKEGGKGGGRGRREGGEEGREEGKEGGRGRREGGRGRREGRREGGREGGRGRREGGEGGREGERRREKE